MAKRKTNKSKSTTKKKTGEKDTKDLVEKECTDEEKARLAKHRERKERRPVKFKAAKSDSIALQDPDDPLIAVKTFEALGTADSDLQAHLLEQILQTFKGTVSEDSQDKEASAIALNRTMAILSGIQPQDELEAMLAAQMIGVHNMAMETLKRAMLKDQTFEGKQVNVNQATKMLRTYIAQMEAIKKYRTGGQQKMVIEHVHVNEGGQAIVGTVNQGGGGNNKNNE
ncbi:MAG: hypothetical protein ACYSW0_04650 [Planctomycetota bacterium]|jgi:hypothetical protein